MRKPTELTPQDVQFLKEHNIESHGLRIVDEFFGGDVPSTNARRLSATMNRYEESILLEGLMRTTSIFGTDQDSALNHISLTGTVRIEANQFSPTLVTIEANNARLSVHETRFRLISEETDNG